MNAFYTEIRLIHLYAVAASGGLFFLRGLLSFGPLLLFNRSTWPGERWAMAAPVRYLSYTIDTVLLTAAFMLMNIIRQYPIANAWLTVKVVLLVIYVVLGYQAFRHRQRKTWGTSLWLTALVMFGLMISVARAHHPLGFLSYLL